MHDRTETDTGPIPQQRTQTFVSGRTLSYAPPADQVDTSDAEWHAGGQVGDFVLLETLGRGAFGTVYLARQQSLDRLIALKVSAGGSAGRGEAVTLAGLEHDHIVKVFAEFTEEPTGRHCLCLQYVAGTNMADVIQDVHTRETLPTTGLALLEAVDRQARGESRFDPGALRDRALLAADTFAQAVARVGEKLARALAFAHSRNVLHCDIKPANILVTPYGRPLLADFNVSFDRDRRDPGDNRVGGTLQYMAPEHRAALYGNPDAVVDERSDIYSLGIVLHELTAGAVPVTDDPELSSQVTRELAHVIRRCLQPNPALRYPTADGLADALVAVRELLAARRRMPSCGRVGRWATRHPFMAIAAVALLPHLVATVLNIGYNRVQIDLNPAQTEAFVLVTLIYNVLIYPAIFVVGWRVLSSVRDGYEHRDDFDGPALDRYRRQSLALGYWAIGMAVAGWIPGGIIFPLWIDCTSECVHWPEYVHFAVSFTLSGLVGVVFSYLGVQTVVMRAVYPVLTNPDRFTAAEAARELRPTAVLLTPCLVLASALPLTGAVLLLVLADGMGGDGRLHLGFRVLIVGLIGLGMGGVGLASRLTTRLERLVAVWGRGGLNE